MGLTNRLIGIEIDDRWASFAAKRLAAYPNVEVVCGDVFDVLGPEGTIYYLFNPFTRETMERFKQHLVACHGSDDPITVVYYMANFAELFENDPAWQVSPVIGKTFHRSIIARRTTGS